MYQCIDMQATIEFGQRAFLSVANQKTLAEWRQDGRQMFDIQKRGPRADIRTLPALEQVTLRLAIPKNNWCGRPLMNANGNIMVDHYQISLFTYIYDAFCTINKTFRHK